MIKLESLTETPQCALLSSGINMGYNRIMVIPQYW